MLMWFWIWYMVMKSLGNFMYFNVGYVFLYCKKDKNVLLMIVIENIW